MLLRGGSGNIDETSFCDVFVDAAHGSDEEVDCFATFVERERVQKSAGTDHAKPMQGDGSEIRPLQSLFSALSLGLRFQACEKLSYQIRSASE